MPSLTLKEIPEDLHQQLKAEARSHGRSLTKEVYVRLRLSLARRAPDAAEIAERARKVRGLFRGDLEPARVDRLKRQGRA
jgi:plasmid stability protein